jgi:hypothetical protein
MMHNVGNIVLLNRKKGGWFSTLQRFFTKMDYTHCAIVVTKYKNREMVLSADELIELYPLQKYFEEKDTDIEIWELEGDYEAITDILIDRYVGTYYGFTQVFWFVFRWFMEIFGKDVRRYRNPFCHGTICSELVWYFLEAIPNENLNDRVHEWNPDTIHAGDTARICREFFKLKHKNY